MILEPTNRSTKTRVNASRTVKGVEVEEVEEVEADAAVAVAGVDMKKQDRQATSLMRMLPHLHLLKSFPLSLLRATGWTLVILRQQRLPALRGEFTQPASKDPTQCSATMLGSAKHHNSPRVTQQNQHS